MFDQSHLNSLKASLEKEIPNILERKAEKLEKEYKKNTYINTASVTVIDETVDIKLGLNFTPRDEEQNIPAVFEMGGIIFDNEDNIIEIEPNFYIRKIFADNNRY